MPEIYNADKQTTASETPKVKPQVKPEKRKPHDYSEVMRRHKATTNPLAAFMVQPPRVMMSIQDVDERILLVLRRHFITNVQWLFVVFVMLIAPMLIAMLPFPTVLPERFILGLSVLWYLLTIGITLEGFLSWYFNVFVITDERIIDVDFMNLIYKNVSAAKIDNIEDVTVQMGGAVRSVLNFGTVFVQTAAERTQFEFEDVPRPQEVAKFLNELILEEQREELEGRVS